MTLLLIVFALIVMLMTLNITECRSDLSARLLVIEQSDQIVRRLAPLLEQHRGLEVCCHSPCVTDAVNQARLATPTIAAVDLCLPGESGFVTLRRLQLRTPPMRILAFAPRTEPLYVERVLQAGAHAYIIPDDSQETLANAIGCILAGRLFTGELIASRLIRRYVDPSHENPDPPLSLLSIRELEVFELLGLGLSGSEIGRRLHVSSKTVASHCDHMKRKMGIASTAELRREAKAWVRQVAPPPRRQSASPAATGR